jgi:hypothetical protein
MQRGWLLTILCAVLLLWRPLDFVFELSQSLPSMGMRGAAGALELVFHALVAAVSVAAARALWNVAPAGPLLAAIALVASAAATVQTLYWTALPHQTIPGTEALLSALATGHAAIWLVYLKLSRRVRAIANG